MIIIRLITERYITVRLIMVRFIIVRFILGDCNWILTSFSLYTTYHCWTRSRDLEKLAMKVFKENLAVKSIVGKCEEGNRYDLTEVVFHYLYYDVL